MKDYTIHIQDLLMKVLQKKESKIASEIRRITKKVVNLDKDTNITEVPTLSNNNKTETHAEHRVTVKDTNINRNLVTSTEQLEKTVIIKPNDKNQKCLHTKRYSANI
ncbi:unnamed protein product [Acanthoscelides obtectus]|uniref:Uncharacterized protein n=1 Tax=Acanthoscelides obtectus TaxID=200917 RepID=A0A9P0Q776_ACAOB|nr:unnamed protein product [Acanthoscelides obtectus]CAK1624625.1 hypothetical protein AOBTE_LOCUS2657 [Acanthoscelides obtectus]